MPKPSFQNEIILSFPYLKVVEFDPNYKLRYTKHQKQLLETFYKAKPNPTQKDKSALADRTLLTIRQVCVWFQNRRAKDRKSSTKPINKLSLANLIHAYDIEITP
ncbi:hypothetical protein DSO57_1006208 [Entomophthora muscae]|uniref:Uncharacterized protein n=1 Tax=Entomophthora muscae TaxID=34485 RepID=A0ACC2SAE1_9FUNG|nr:hypothetical protein DSO57_1006208 [Entomophthora muscae]